MHWARLFPPRLPEANMVVGSRPTRHQQEVSPMTRQINVLGIDIATRVLHIVGTTWPRASPPCVATDPSVVAVDTRRHHGRRWRER